MALTFDKILGNEPETAPVKPKVTSKEDTSPLTDKAPVVKTDTGVRRGLGGKLIQPVGSTGTSEATQVRATTTPPVGVTSPVKSAKSVTTEDKPKATRKRKVAEPVPEVVEEGVDPSIIGTCSDKWEYVGAITDDSRPDRNVINDSRAMGGKIKIVNGKFIGYILRPLVDDMVYYETEIDYRYYRSLYTLNWDKVVEKRTKAGEDIVMTIAEAVALTARPEVNGVISGGKYPVMAAYTAPKGAGVANLDVSKVKPDEFEWGGYLRPASGGVPLKQLPLFTGISLKEGGVQMGTRSQREYVVHEGFERFAPAVDFSKKPSRAELKEAQRLAQQKAIEENKLRAEREKEALRKAQEGRKQAEARKAQKEAPKVTRNAQSAAFFKAWNARRTN